MLDYSSWTVVRTLTSAASMPLITVPVAICLSKIAKYTKLTLQNGLYMTEHMTYNELVEWYGATKAHTSKIQTTSGGWGTLQEMKVPIF